MSMLLHETLVLTRTKFLLLPVTCNTFAILYFCVGGWYAGSDHDKG